MKKLFNFIILMIVIGTVSQFFGSNSEDSNENQTTIAEAETTMEETSAKLAYDHSEMNSKIIDSFEESVRFHEQGEDGYEWTQYIYELELQKNEAIHVTVEDSFLELSDKDKTLVLNSVNNMVNAQIFLVTEESKSYYITARDKNGNKVAQSKMLNVLEYTFE